MKRIEFLIESAMFEVWAFGRLTEMGLKMICFKFHRPQEEQQIEFDAGRSRTLDSKHKKWRAKDYAIVQDLDDDGIVDKDEIRWGFNIGNPYDPYLILGKEWEKRGGIWGGRWLNPIDPYHFEG
jgi:hypothetical protein